MSATGYEFLSYIPYRSTEEFKVGDLVRIKNYRIGSLEGIWIGTNKEKIWRGTFKVLKVLNEVVRLPYPDGIFNSEGMPWFDIASISVKKIDALGYCPDCGRGQSDSARHWPECKQLVGNFDPTPTVPAA